MTRMTTLRALAGALVLAMTAAGGGVDRAAAQTHGMPSTCPEPPEGLVLPLEAFERSPVPMAAQVEAAKALRDVCGYQSCEIARVLGGVLRSHPYAEIPDVLTAAGFDAQGVAVGLRCVGVEARRAVVELKRLQFPRSAVVSGVVRGYALPPQEQPIALASKDREGNQVVMRGYRPEAFAQDLVALQSGSGAEQLRALAATFRLANEQARGPRSTDSTRPDVVLQSLANAAATVSLSESEGTAAKPTRRARRTKRSRRARRQRARARRSAASALDIALLEAVKALRADDYPAVYVLAILQRGYEGGRTQPVETAADGSAIELPVSFGAGGNPLDSEPSAATVKPQTAAVALRLVSQAGYDRTEMANGLLSTYLAEQTAASRFIDVGRLFRRELGDKPCDTARLLSDAFARNPAQIAGALKALGDSAVEAMRALKCGVNSTSGPATKALTAGLTAASEERSGLADYPITAMPQALAAAYKRTSPTAVYSDLQAAGFSTPDATARALVLTALSGSARASRLTQLVRTYKQSWKLGDRRVSDLNARTFALDVAKGLRAVALSGARPSSGDMARALLRAPLGLADSAAAIRQVFKLNPHEAFMVFRPVVGTASEVALLFEIAGTPKPTAKGDELLNGPVGKRVLGVLLGKPQLREASAVTLIKRAFSVSELMATRAYRRAADHRPDISASSLVKTYLEAFPHTRLTTLAKELRSDYPAKEILAAFLPHIRRSLGGRGTAGTARTAASGTQLLSAATGLLLNAGFPAGQSGKALKEVLPSVPAKAGDALKALLVPTPAPSDPAPLPKELDPSPLLKTQGPGPQMEVLKHLGYEKCPVVTAVAGRPGTTRPDAAGVLTSYEAVFGRLSGTPGFTAGPVTIPHIPGGFATLAQCIDDALNFNTGFPVREVKVSVDSVRLGYTTVQIDAGVLVGHVGLSWAGLDITRGLPDQLLKVPLFATDDNVKVPSSRERTVVNPANLTPFAGADLPHPRQILLPDIPLGHLLPVPKLSVDVTFYSRPGGFCLLPSSTDAAYHAAATLVPRDVYLRLPGKSRDAGIQKWSPSDDGVAYTPKSAVLEIPGMGPSSGAERPTRVTTSMRSEDHCGSIRSGTWNFTASVTSKRVDPDTKRAAALWYHPGRDASRIGAINSPSQTIPTFQAEHLYPGLFGWLDAIGWSGSPADVKKLADGIRAAT